MKTLAIVLLAFSLLNSCATKKPGFDPVSYLNKIANHCFTEPVTIASQSTCFFMQKDFPKLKKLESLEVVKTKLIKNCDTKSSSRGLKILSCSLLGQYYFEKKEIEKSVNYYNTACGHGVGVACTYVGVFYEEGNMGLKSLEYYDKGCMYKDPSACNKLGLILSHQGKVEEASKLYMRGCMQEDGESCYNLACSFSVMKKKVPALKSLEYAFRFGFNSYSKLANTELDYIRNSVEFRILVKSFSIKATI